MHRSQRLCFLIAVFAAWIPIVATGAPDLQAARPVPDLTAGGKRDESHDWTLGPTGARGWMHTANGHSRDARQILITAVAKDSPADG